MEGAKYEGQRDEKRAEAGSRGVMPATDVPKHEQQRGTPQLRSIVVRVLLSVSKHARTPR